MNMNNKDWTAADRLQVALMSKGLSARQFAMQSRIGHHELNAELVRLQRKPGGILRIDIAQKVAWRTGCSIQWLLTGQGDPYICVSPEALAKFEESREIAALLSPRRKE